MAALVLGCGALTVRAEEPQVTAAQVAQIRADAEQGDAMAQCILGGCYAFGWGVKWGVKPDKEKAVYWYRKAAEQGFAPAQYNLGGCYENGDGVPKDLEKAVYWYRKAAAQGHEGANAMLKRLGY